jgi:hypothetical protein
MERIRLVIVVFITYGTSFSGIMPSLAISTMLKCPFMLTELGQNLCGQRNLPHIPDCIAPGATIMPPVALLPRPG